VNPQSVRTFYEGELGVKLPQPNSAGEIGVHCPFHSDAKPSMSINAKTGLWKCFSCGAGGSMADFYMDMHGVDLATAKAAVDKGQFLPTVDDTEIDEWHCDLLDDSERVDWLTEHRGISLKTIKKFHIGWDGNRYTIPIYDQARRVVNVRRYDPSGSGSNKVISYAAGYGASRLFPLSVFERKTVVVLEGEMDTLLAHTLGLPAVTSTGGAGTWKENWNRYFVGKVVYICYDIDEQGKKGAIRVAKQLSKVAKEVHVVTLPKDGMPDNGDFTDYILMGHTREDFKAYLVDSPIFGAGSKTQEGVPETAIELHLSEASRKEYYNKAIAMNVIVAGKDLAPFLVPKSVHFKCDGGSSKKCQGCALVGTMGDMTITFPTRSPLLLELINCPSGVQKGLMKQEAGIPSNCKDFEYEIAEAYNIEEVFLMPEIDFSSNDAEYVMRRAFYVGNSIHTNQNYHVEGVTLPEPHRQYATHLLDIAVPSQDDVSSFSMTPEIMETLKIFRQGVGQTVSEKFDEIHADFTANVTHIYGRKELLAVADLVYHSVISFDFQSKRIIKGWNEAVIVGDTRTGKSETITTLMQHYRMGELITGENTSFAGLVGGMQQNDKRWLITWGKIPTNDRRLVVVDEIGSLPEEAIQRMSGMRSSGVAEITKIQTEKTHARTRLIFIGNPRNGKSMGSYAFGVNALRELIGAPEDIARFDLAYAAAGSDVPLDVINAEFKTHERVKNVYTSDLCNTLIRWVWSRRPEHVKFANGVEKAILDLATLQGQTYSNRVPLIEAANQRIKIAKLSIAVAARLFSTDKTGEQIVVKKEHVEYVAEVIDRLYKMKSLGYYEFSRQQMMNLKIGVEKRQEIYSMMMDNEILADTFLSYSYIRVKDLEDMLDCERAEANHIIKELVKAKMLFKTSNGFTKAPAFTDILREVQTDRLDKEEAR
jgi:hypothetical protein